MKVNLNEHFIATRLSCPDSVRRIEYVSKTVSGFFVEVRSNRDNYGTYFYRGKDIHGKTLTQKDIEYRPTQLHGSGKGM